MNFENYEKPDLTGVTNEQLCDMIDSYPFLDVIRDEIKRRSFAEISLIPEEKIPERLSGFEKSCYFRYSYFRKFYWSFGPGSLHYYSESKRLWIETIQLYQKVDLLFFGSKR